MMKRSKLKKILILLCSIMFVSLVFVLVGASITKNIVSIAHRGFGVKGNTRAAFNASFAFDAMECDIRITKDQKFVVNHDSTMKGKDGNYLSISDSFYSELKEKCGEFMLLEDFLEIASKKNQLAVIDLKSYILTEDDIDIFLNIIKSSNIDGNVIVMSYTQEIIQSIKNKSNYDCYYVFASNLEANLAFCEANNINLSVHYSEVTKELVERCHNNGLKVNVWTVNEYFAYLRFAAMGVDFITSDIFAG